MTPLETALAYAKDFALVADCESDRMLVTLAAEVRRLLEQLAEEKRKRDQVHDDLVLAMAGPAVGQGGTMPPNYGGG